MYRIGDKVTLKGLDFFEEYNGLEFTIIDIYMGLSYRVKRSGFDAIWVTEHNFV